MLVHKLSRVSALLLLIKGGPVFLYSNHFHGCLANKFGKPLGLSRFSMTRTSPATSDRSLPSGKATGKP